MTGDAEIEHRGQQFRSDAALTKQLARLWPNRQHESNWVRDLLCAFGMHRWSKLNLDHLLPGKEVEFCRWCPKIRVGGVIYD